MDARVDDLLASLTMDEKVTQFGNYQEPIPRLGIQGFQFWTGEAAAAPPAAAADGGNGKAALSS
jgi:hypothetical protein